MQDRRPDSNLVAARLLASEMAVSSVVNVTVGEGRSTRRASVEGAIEVRYARPATIFQNAIAVPHIVIAETSTAPAQAPGRPREIKFSTKGLSKALDELQKDCGEAKAADDAKLRR
jgi:hypothetical protein